MGDDAERVLKIDLNVSGWTIPEARAYRRAAGVNPEYAGEVVDRAFRATDDEARETFGAQVDEEGWTPPEDWMPLCLANFDPDYLLGFFWIPARRADPSIEYEAFAASVPYGDLLAAFWAFVMESAEKAEAESPLGQANRATRRATGQRGKTASRSRTSSAGRSPKPKPSRSASSKTASSTETTG
ncbi:MAG TPA: hypothetical protein DCQ64_18115 [Candidatus Rokubacteria bacterium]|nr:hypothetical protein [Candidatus Rokubacteria bacterium]